MDSVTIVLCLLLGLVAIYMISSCTVSCGRNSKDNYVHALEFQEKCNDDGRRQCTMSNGWEGKCVLNGYCATSMLYDPREFSDSM